MYFLGLVSGDDALSHAISEQFKQAAGDWSCAAFETLESALGAWGEALPSVLFWDVETSPASEELLEFFLHQLGRCQPVPLILVLGEVPQPLESFGITEAFGRPLRLGYFLTRLQFYQRLLQQSPDVEARLGSWDFAARTRTLTARDRGEEIRLTEKETALLSYLYAAKAFVPRDELLAAIWGYDAQIDTHTLETHIYRLRRKLMMFDPDGPDAFLSEGGGYQINPAWREE